MAFEEIPNDSTTDWTNTLNDTEAVSAIADIAIADLCFCDTIVAPDFFGPVSNDDTKNWSDI